MFKLAYLARRIYVAFATSGMLAVLQATTILQLLCLAEPAMADSVCDGTSNVCVDEVALLQSVPAETVLLSDMGTRSQKRGGKAKRLTQHAMLEAHDAAMVYMGDKDRSCKSSRTQSFNYDKAPWFRKSGTYPSGFSGLLDCGARALDLRLKPCNKDIGHICLHHSGAELEMQTLESEIGSIVQWANDNPDELVLLKLVLDKRFYDHNSISDAEFYDIINTLLDHHHIKSINTRDRDGKPSKGCWAPETQAWTTETAMQRSKLVGSGHVLAVWQYTDEGADKFNCIEDNFKHPMGFDPRQSGPSFDRIFTYMDHTLATQYNESSPYDGDVKLQELQMMWQWDNTHDVYGSGYAIVEVNGASGLNAIVPHIIRGYMDSGREAGTTPNLVKFDNICQYGTDVAKALGTPVSHDQEQRCIDYCGGSNHLNTCA